MGTIEILTIANRAFGHPPQQSELERLDTVLAEIRNGNPLRANNPKLEHPGLMTGTSGIGMGLLRLAYPEVVPSVLLLEPPVQPNKASRLGRMSFAPI